MNKLCSFKMLLWFRRGYSFGFVLLFPNQDCLMRVGRMGSKSGFCRLVIVFPVLPLRHGDTFQYQTLRACHHQMNRMDRGAVYIRKIYWLWTCHWPDFGEEETEWRTTDLLQLYIGNTLSRYMKETAYFLTQVCTTRYCWWTTKRKIQAWGTLTASDEVLDCFYGVFQWLYRKRKWYGNM